MLPLSTAMPIPNPAPPASAAVSATAAITFFGDQPPGVVVAGGGAPLVGTPVQPSAGGVHSPSIGAVTGSGSDEGCP